MRESRATTAMRPRAFLTVVSAFTLCLAVPGRARATHPDYDGERGLELQAQFGIAGYGTTNDSVFFAPGDVPPEGPLSSFGGSGLGLRAAVGYRFAPWISAGFTIGWQSVPATDQYSSTEFAMGARDSFSGYSLGAYARLYFLAFASGSRENPRVFFTSATDLRRFDPWVSLGVDFVSSLHRSRSYSDPQTNASWTTSYVGIPLALGADYRVFPRFAVGIGLTLTPLLGASTSKTLALHETRPGVDVVVTSTDAYTPASGTNVDVFFGLTARYTLTF